MVIESSSTVSATLFRFRHFEALPCGCVAADYVAHALALDVLALEAKGPHCTDGHHTDGTLLALDRLSVGSATALA
jgi:hypothetical protein